MRVLLILVDGMRPDALKNIPQANSLMRQASYTLEGTTVIPSVTLPCHMSLFHSVDPSRHGTTTNIFAPQVRPVDGLCEVLAKNGKACAFFYVWGELRDLCKPQSLAYSYLCNQYHTGFAEANDITTDAAIKHLTSNFIDFSFLYIGETDEIGHKYGWMSEEYLGAMKHSWENIEKVLRALPDDYTVIITADHGGHGRSHGTDLPEDMTIPLFFKGKNFKAGKQLENVNIKDIAPTITKLFDIAPDKEWEGKGLI